MKLFKVIILSLFVIAIVILWCGRRIDTFPAVLLVLCFLLLIFEKIFGKKEKDYFQPK